MYDKLNLCGLTEVCVIHSLEQLFTDINSDSATSLKLKSFSELQKYHNYYEFSQHGHAQKEPVIFYSCFININR